MLGLVVKIEHSDPLLIFGFHEQRWICQRHLVLMSYQAVRLWKLQWPSHDLADQGTSVTFELGFSKQLYGLSWLNHGLIVLEGI